MTSSFKIRILTERKDFSNFYVQKDFEFGQGTLYVLYIDKEMQMSIGGWRGR